MPLPAKLFPPLPSITDQTPRRQLSSKPTIDDAEQDRDVLQSLTADSRSAESNFRSSSRIFRLGLDGMSQRSSRDSTGETDESGGWCSLRRFCLNPKLPLKHQLFLSFDILAILSLVFVMTVAVALAHQAGVMVKRVATDSFEEWSQDKFFLTTKVVAETMHVEFNLEEGVSALLYETTRDRFSGYPNHTGYANDLLVPFPDTVSGVNVYPIQAANLLPLDWNIDPTDPVMNPELFLGRETWYDAPVSMFTPSIHFQGTCDPSSTDPQDVMYYRNCTDANNDLQTGGIVQPTTTFQQIHRKVSDYAPPIMKSLFEITASLETIVLFFANDGDVSRPSQEQPTQLPVRRMHMVVAAQSVRLVQDDRDRSPSQPLQAPWNHCFVQPGL